MHCVGAKSSFMERCRKTAIIEEKWLQKRKQEPERRLQKKRRELTSEEEEAPDFQSLRGQPGHQTVSEPTSMKPF